MLHVDNGRLNVDPDFMTPILYVHTPTGLALLALGVNGVRGVSASAKLTRVAEFQLLEPGR